MIHSVISLRIGFLSKPWACRDAQRGGSLLASIACISCTCCCDAMCLLRLHTNYKILVFPKIENWGNQKLKTMLKLHQTTAPSAQISKPLVPLILIISFENNCNETNNSYLILHDIISFNHNRYNSKLNLATISYKVTIQPGEITINRPIAQRRLKTPKLVIPIMPITVMKTDAKKYFL